MTDILIDNLYPVSGTHAPTNNTDGSGTFYTSWELLDTVAFNVTIPTGYVEGSDLVLSIVESTPGVLQKHKWQLVALLNGTNTETFTSEITSNAVANTVVTSEVDASTSGDIQSVALTGGDLVSFTLTRIAASSTEDANDIKVYSIYLTTSVAETDLSSTERLPTIIRQVLRKVNDDDQRIVSQEQILDWVNECIQEVAGHDYWRTSASLDIVADQANYSLLTLYPTLVDIDSIVWEATNSKLIPVSTWDQYVKLLNVTSSTTTPYCYFVDSNTLHLVPTPSASTSAGATVYYSYCPSALDLVTNTTVPLPKSYDTTIQAYCMMCFYARDRHAHRRWICSDLIKAHGKNNCRGFWRSLTLLGLE